MTQNQIMPRQKTIKNWQGLEDDEIMQLRVRDLGVQIGGSWLEPLIGQLYEELSAKNIKFRPPCYLADEWLCPDKSPIIGIPFCLAEGRLKHIEQKMMFEVEGGTEKSCMRLLRHECGHAINYAYKLYKKTRWRELFGPFSAQYCDSYYYRPYSKRYVIHLEGNYAQAHPDEDFAETFAVWLNPQSKWQLKYKDWPVLKKLNYVDDLMKKIAEQEPVTRAEGKPPWSADRMTSTLASFYERKRKGLGMAFQGYYDDNLLKLFGKEHSGNSSVKASIILREHRRMLVLSVTKWTGHRKYDIYALLHNLSRRCDTLNLYAKTDDINTIIAMTSLLTAIASNTLLTQLKSDKR